MPSTNFHLTIEKFRETFARFRFCKIVVSDNARHFTSQEFTEFLDRNGVKCMVSSLLRASSNGCAENAVNTIKYFMQKKCSKNNRVDITMTPNRLLTMYRNTAHCSQVKVLSR